MTTTTNRSSDTATLRALAKACGVEMVSIVAGRGCARGMINVRVKSGATRVQRVDAVAFLIAVGAECPAMVFGLAHMPEHFPGCYVRSFEMAADAYAALAAA